MSAAKRFLYLLCLVSSFQQYTDCG